MNMNIVNTVVYSCIHRSGVGVIKYRVYKVKYVCAYVNVNICIHIKLKY